MGAFGKRVLPLRVVAQHRFAKLDPRRPVPARVVRQQAMPDEDVTGGAVPFHARIGVELDDAPLVRLVARQALGVAAAGHG